MVITKTPFRISFFGGGSDYPNYYLKYGGKVLGTTIDKYCYLNIRKLPPFFDYKYRVVYSKQESKKNINEIEHPSVKHTLKYLNIEYGISINYDGDIPARSGMGSSSAFTVGLLNGLYALNGTMVTKEKLAKEAIHIEQNLIKENVGSQDQTFAAYGGLNLIEFLQNGEIVVTPIILNKEKFHTFEENIMLFFSGIARNASEIAKEQISKIDINKEKIDKMKKLVDEAYEILIKKNLNEFGELLNYTWNLKKSLSNNITNPVIEEMYEKAVKAGALGGKLLGAGGGGFMAFYVPKKNQAKVKEALKDFLYIPIKFETNGSKIIFFNIPY
jgi:D-glycero-alpha-D-manno-heptose-7-phosphate kinase